MWSRTLNRRRLHEGGLLIVTARMGERRQARLRRTQDSSRLRRIRDAEARHRRRARPRYGVRVGRGRVGGEAEELVVVVGNT